MLRGLEILEAISDAEDGSCTAKGVLKSTWVVEITGDKLNAFAFPEGGGGFVGVACSSADLSRGIGEEGIGDGGALEESVSMVAYKCAMGKFVNASRVKGQ